MDIKLSITNDLDYVDALEYITIRIATTSGSSIDFVTSTATDLFQEVKVKGLFRQNSTRNAGSVRSLRDRENALQMEYFNKADTIIEIVRDAIPPEYKIKQGDTIIRACDQSKWVINGVDFSTLGTRIRIGVSKFV
jgi:hypothetical protein